MPGAVENTIEVDGIELPSCCYGGDVFVEACDEGDVTGAGFSWYSCMRDAEGAVVEDAGAKVGCQMARLEVGIGLGVWVRELLKGFVCSQSVAWHLISVGSLVKETKARIPT